jgi:hypothetical protein
MTNALTESDINLGCNYLAMYYDDAIRNIKDLPSLCVNGADVFVLNAEKSVFSGQTRS